MSLSKRKNLKAERTKEEVDESLKGMFFFFALMILLKKGKEEEYNKESKGSSSEDSIEILSDPEDIIFESDARDSSDVSDVSDNGKSNSNNNNNNNNNHSPKFQDFEDQSDPIQFKKKKVQCKPNKKRVGMEQYSLNKENSEDETEENSQKERAKSTDDDKSTNEDETMEEEKPTTDKEKKPKKRGPKRKHVDLSILEKAKELPVFNNNVNVKAKVGKSQEHREKCWAISYEDGKAKEGFCYIKDSGKEYHFFPMCRQGVLYLIEISELESVEEIKKRNLVPCKKCKNLTKAQWNKMIADNKASRKKETVEHRNLVSKVSNIEKKVKKIKNGESIKINKTEEEQKEHRRKYNKNYEAEHPEKMKEYAKTKYENIIADPSRLERKRELGRITDQNPERKDRQATWRRNNPEKLAQSGKNYRQSEHGKAKTQERESRPDVKMYRRDSQTKRKRENVEVYENTKKCIIDTYMQRKSVDDVKSSASYETWQKLVEKRAIEKWSSAQSNMRTKCIKKDCRESKSCASGKHKFEISKESVLKFIQEDCIYCGITFMEHGDMSLDRVENDRGYELDNVVPCCTMCNYMKGEACADDYILNCKNIAITASSKETFRSFVNSKVSNCNTFYEYKNDKEILPTSFYGYMERATKLEVSFSIDQKEYDALSSLDCFYCDRKPTFGVGLDRIDPSGSYSKENCVACCYRCNMAKHTYDASEFVLKCIRVANFTNA